MYRHSLFAVALLLISCKHSSGPVKERKPGYAIPGYKTVPLSVHEKSLILTKACGPYAFVVPHSGQFHGFQYVDSLPAIRGGIDSLKNDVLAFKFFVAKFAIDDSDWYYRKNQLDLTLGSPQRHVFWIKFPDFNEKFNELFGQFEDTWENRMRIFTFGFRHHHGNMTWKLKNLMSMEVNVTMDSLFPVRPPWFDEKSLAWGLFIEHAILPKDSFPLINISFKLRSSIDTTQVYQSIQPCQAPQNRGTKMVPKIDEDAMLHAALPRFRACPSGI